MPGNWSSIHFLASRNGVLDIVFQEDGICAVFSGFKEIEMLDRCLGGRSKIFERFSEYVEYGGIGVQPS